jgi:hypothetical protein
VRQQQRHGRADLDREARAPDRPIGSARVTLPAGRTVKARVKVSKPARRLVGRRGLRATATLSVPGAAAARAVVRLIAASR